MIKSSATALRPAVAPSQRNSAMDSATATNYRAHLPGRRIAAAIFTFGYAIYAFVRRTRQRNTSSARDPRLFQRTTMPHTSKRWGNTFKASAIANASATPKPCVEAGAAKSANSSQAAKSMHQRCSVQCVMHPQSRRVQNLENIPIMPCRGDPVCAPPISWPRLRALAG